MGHLQVVISVIYLVWGDVSDYTNHQLPLEDMAKKIVEVYSCSLHIIQ